MSAAEPSNVVALPGGLTPVELLHQMVRAASGEIEVVEADLPMPPAGASARAQGLWYGVLKAYGPLSIPKMQLLEAIVDNVSQYDRVKGDWEAEGSPTTATGSMGQPVEDNRIGSMKTLRSQEASLWKQIDLANESGGAKGRPGRPTRAESLAMGKSSSWGRG